MKTWSRNLGIVTILMFAFVQSAWAGGCRIETVELDKFKASEHLAHQVQRKAFELQKIMESRGQQLNVLIVARLGEDLSKHELFRQDHSLNFQEYMDRVASWENTETFERLKSPERLTYSHMGFLIRRAKFSEINDADKIGDWQYVSHLLADCDEKSRKYGDSYIFAEPFSRFFWDTKMLDDKNPRDRAFLAIPSQQIQNTLLDLIHNQDISTYEGGIHEPNYNVASVPFSLRPFKARKKEAPPAYYQLKDQNSNQWPLEMIAAATRPYGTVVNRRQAQDVLWQTQYRPSVMQLHAGLKGLGCKAAKMGFAKNLINCEDQVFRPQQLTQLITVKSVIDYMSYNGFLADDPLQPGRPAAYDVAADPNFMKTVKILSKILEKAKKQKEQKAAEDEERERNRR